VLAHLLNATQAVLRVVDDLGPGPVDPDVADQLADRAAVRSLLDAGLGVASEESGRSGWDRAVRVVVDPIDGSYNLGRGVPHVASSMWAFDDAGGIAAVVRFLPGGRTFHATQGGGAYDDGRRLEVAAAAPEAELLVAGPSSTPDGIWSRRLGASAVELCFLAAGALDGFAAPDGEALPVWDYLAGLLIAVEAGCVATELDGADLWDPDVDAPRRPVVATDLLTLERLRRVAEGERAALGHSEGLGGRDGRERFPSPLSGRR
jgi:myo-inositol-1(or 4)-monophosphatase